MRLTLSENDLNVEVIENHLNAFKNNENNVRRFKIKSRHLHGMVAAMTERVKVTQNCRRTWYVKKSFYTKKCNIF